MSNCVVGSGGFELPCSVIVEHSVECCDHFSHDGDDDDLGFVSASGRRLEKALRAGLYRLALKAARKHYGPAFDPRKCCGVEKTDEGGDLLAAHLTEFWRQSDEREGQHRADAWHRGQRLIEPLGDEFTRLDPRSSWRS